MKPEALSAALWAGALTFGVVALVWASAGLSLVALALALAGEAAARRD